jgi:epoxyqueuosine reductase
MDAINSRIAEGMKQHHYKFKMVSIAHLPEVQDAVGKLVRQGMINEKLHSGWHFYKDNNTGSPEAKAIIIVVMPQYITRVSFRWQGKNYYCNVPPTYFTQTDDACAEAILKEALEISGYKMAKARLPLKTLAVRSGLAKYGRNNITYALGMGSFYRLIAFYTDYSGTEDTWREPEMMKACENCSLCRANCPTGSITSERFLIYAEKCLTRLNEAEDVFPQGVKPEWHNALIGCMSCQQVCPVNMPFLNNIADGPDFTEEETELILNRTPVEKLGIETQRKLEHMIQDGLYPYVGRNLRVLIEKQRNEI